MAELLRLCLEHEVSLTDRRRNISYDGEAVPSEMITHGPIFDAVKNMNPGFVANAVQCNVDLFANAHRDVNNRGPSRISRLSGVGGAVALEDGRRLCIRPLSLGGL